MCHKQLLQNPSRAAALAAVILLIPSFSLAEPTGGTIVGGSGTISQSEINTTINQATGRLAIEWQTFNVAENESVQFIQPDINAIALNRILDENPSEIFGRIDANGHIVLVNPRGVLFGRNATVNAGGIIASALDIDSNAFMNGEFYFSAVANSEGRVINYGLLNAATGGSVSLIGQSVVNDGLISARLGAVNLASGAEAVVTFDADGLIGVEVTQKVLENDLGIDSAILNSGNIEAVGGQVLMTARVSQDLFSNAVNNEGLVRAASIQERNGKILLLGDGADVNNSGTLDVSAQDVDVDAGSVEIYGENIYLTGQVLADASAGNGGTVNFDSNNTTMMSADGSISAVSDSNGVGGDIKVLGEYIALLDSATINASGELGGGTVLIGGDRQGLNPEIHNAQGIYLGQNSSVMVDATMNGDGGTLVTFAEDVARLYGLLSARGGQVSGDGGFVETSGKQFFELLNAPLITAENGSGGYWLIDPYDIEIIDIANNENIDDSVANLFSPSAAVARLDIDALYDALFNGNGVTVEITTENAAGLDLGNITFTSDLDFDDIGSGVAGPQADTLLLNADNNIIINARIYDSDNANNLNTGGASNDLLNVQFLAGNQVSFGANGSVETGGGSFQSNSVSFDSSQGTIATSGGRNTAGGNIDITTTSGDLLLGTVLSSATNPNVTNISNDGNADLETNARDMDGADGGDITLITNNGNIIVSGRLDASGAVAEGVGGSGGRSGGNSGNISIDANGDGILTGNVQVQEVVATGGDGDARGSSNNGGGGDAGDVEFEANGTISLAGNVEAKGGEEDDFGTNPIDGSGGNITFNGIIQETGDATVSTGPTSGNIVFLQNIQDSNSSLQLEAGAGSITLGGDTTLSSLTFVSANNGLNLAGNLTTLMASQDLDFTPVSEIYINSSSTITSGRAIRTDNDFTVAASAANTYNLIFASPVILEDHININSGSNNGSVTFSSTVNGDAPNTQDLIIDAGSGDIAFNNAVGGVDPLRNITLAGDAINFNSAASVDASSIIINNSGTLTIAAGPGMDLDGNFNQVGLGGVSLGAGIRSADGNITFGNAVDIGNTLAQEVIVAPGTLVTLNANNGDITFNKSINGGGGGLSSLSLLADVNGNGDIQLLDVDLNQLTLSSGGDLNLLGDIDLVNSFNASNVDGSIIVENDISIQTSNTDITTASPVILNGDLTLDTGSGGGNIVVGGSVNGNNSINAYAGNGNVTLSADVGSLAAVTGVDVSGTNINLSGDITSTGVVSLDGATNLNNNVEIDTTDSGASPAGVNILLSGNLAGNGNDFTADAGTTGQFSVLEINNVADLSITANTANMGNILSTGSLLIDATNFSVGDSIVATNQITLNGDGVSQNGSVIQSQNGGVTQQGSLVTASGNFEVTANGDINVALMDTGNGDVILESTTGEISDNNGDLENISANSASLTAADGIGNGDAIETGVDTITLANTNNGDINIQNTGALTIAGANNSATIQGDINVGASGAMTLTGEVQSSGEVVLSSGTGWQQNQGANITAATLVDIDAQNTISQNADITITTTGGEVNVTSNSGGIIMNNARIDAQVGDINLIASGDIIADTLDTGYELGNISVVSTSGNILAARSGSNNLPHFIADRATFDTRSGQGIFGAPDPGPEFYIYADKIAIRAAFSNYRIVGDASDVADNSTFFAGLIETKAEVGGSQRMEVESLAVIDPAVFSKVRNFRVDNYAVKLPEDQLILEEEEDERKNKQDPDIFDEDKPYEAEADPAKTDQPDKPVENKTGVSPATDDAAVSDVSENAGQP